MFLLRERFNLRSIGCLVVVCVLAAIAPLAGSSGAIAAAAGSEAAGEQMVIQVWHADSLAGPMGELKKAFEAQNPDVAVALTSGRSKELAERILSGEACDVFAPSDPPVIKNMFGKIVGGREAAAWYVVFSANEMAVIVKKGNPLGIQEISDLAKDGVSLARVTGAKDMATARTIEFIKRAAAAEGRPELAQQIIDTARLKVNTIPDAVRAVVNGQADAAVVYLSAAVAAGEAVDIVRFPAEVNLSEAIRNAVTVPGTAQNEKAAIRFVKFMLSAEGQEILRRTGQPPVVPPLKEGSVPAGIL